MRGGDGRLARGREQVLGGLGLVARRVHRILGGFSFFPCRVGVAARRLRLGPRLVDRRGRLLRRVAGALARGGKFLLQLRGLPAGLFRSLLREGLRRRRGGDGLVAAALRGLELLRLLVALALEGCRLLF